MKENIDQVERRLAIHEAQCEERWKTIFKRMEEQETHLTRIENILIGIAGAVICGGASVVITMVMMHNSA
jgi:hypothetical protein|tara:strand:- start:69 stop:278 length:210 start_codon:yes stop_codon:yes gene_type:complete